MNTAKKTHPKTCICARCEDERRKQKRRDRDAKRKARERDAANAAEVRRQGRARAGRGVGALLGGGRAGGGGLGAGGVLPPTRMVSQTFEADGKWVAPPGVTHVVITGYGGGGGRGEPPITLDLGHPVRRDLEALHRTGLFGRTVEKVAEGLLLAELRRLVLEGWTNGVVTKIPGPLEGLLDRMRDGVRRGVKKAVAGEAKAAVARAKGRR